jgi:Zn-dependent protease
MEKGASSMRNLYYLRTIRGMPVRLHYTWIVAALLGIPIVAEVVLPAYAADLSHLARILLTALIVALFFLVVLLHECAHLVVARIFGVHVRTLNIYPLGALTRMPSQQQSGRAAFWIAAAGPTMNIAVWWGLTVLANMISIRNVALALDVTALLSLYLGLINLLPGLPLDGGRMAHVLLRLVYGSFEKATRLMRVCGQIIAYGLIALGIVAMLGEQDWPRALAFIAVGWAIREAGGTARRRALVAELLHHLTAADILTKPRRTIGPERTLREFAISLRGRTGDEPTPVIANDAFLGMIDRALLREVPQGYWDTRTVAEAMLPTQQLDAIVPTTPVSMLIPRLAALATSAQSLPMPVVQGGRLLGLIDAEEMLAILELEDEFGLFERGAVAAVTNIPSLGSGAQAGRPAVNQLPS